MVSCGNHVEKDSSELYSAGVQAETVRLMVAIAAQKGYSLSVTDVKNAFLRAPLPDGAEGYGIRPQAALRRAGFVEDGEVWKALKAVYGFRESPRWWGQHRDETLAAARWTRVEDNKTIYCGLIRTVTDGNLWRILESDPRTVGYVVVYVDDILTATHLKNQAGFHEWPSAT